MLKTIGKILMLGTFSTLVTAILLLLIPSLFPVRMVLVGVVVMVVLLSKRL